MYTFDLGDVVVGVNEDKTVATAVLGDGQRKSKLSGNSKKVVSLIDTEFRPVSAVTVEKVDGAPMLNFDGVYVNPSIIPENGKAQIGYYAPKQMKVVKIETKHATYYVAPMRRN